MNALAPAEAAGRPTEAQPHSFTVEDMFAMARAGLLDDDGRYEVIDGELIDMPMDGDLHLQFSAGINLWLVTSLSGDLYVLPNGTLKLSPKNGPSPDFYVAPRSLAPGDVRAPDVRLAVEVSDTSLTRDLRTKADLYARFGIADYWVVDVKAERVLVHRDPTPAGYASVAAVAREEAVEALSIRGLVLRLADLPRFGA